MQLHSFEQTYALLPTAKRMKLRQSGKSINDSTENGWAESENRSSFISRLVNIPDDNQLCLVCFKVSNDNVSLEAIRNILKFDFHRKHGKNS